MQMSQIWDPCLLCVNNKMNFPKMVALDRQVLHGPPQLENTFREIRNKDRTIALTKAWGLEYLSKIFKLAVISNSSLSNDSRWTPLSNVKYIKLSIWVITESVLAWRHLVDERKARSLWFSKTLWWFQYQITGEWLVLSTPFPLKKVCPQPGRNVFYLSTKELWLQVHFLFSLSEHMNFDLRRPKSQTDS